MAMLKTCRSEGPLSSLRLAAAAKALAAMTAAGTLGGVGKGTNGASLSIRSGFSGRLAGFPCPNRF